MNLTLGSLRKEIFFSDDWQQVKTMPEDPPGSVVIGKVTKFSHCIVLFYPISESDVMPFENPQFVIDGIHNCLSDNQGLIEVNSDRQDKTKIYSIVKTKMEPSGVQYCLTFHFRILDEFYCVTGFFSENGITGEREATAFELACRDEIIKENMIGWGRDPYDRNFTKGFLMNLSEDEKFDKMFPFHALSETRRFINKLMEQI